MALPETVWEIRLADGSAARCALVPDRSGFAVVWYLDEHIQGFEAFDHLKQARERAAALRNRLTAETG